MTRRLDLSAAGSGWPSCPLLAAWFTLEYAHARELSQDRDEGRQTSRVLREQSSLSRVRRARSVSCLSRPVCERYSREPDPTDVAVVVVVVVVLLVRVCANTRTKHVCVDTRGATCDGLYSISLPVNSFFPRSAPGATLLLPSRAESRATTLVLITIRIYEVLSLCQPNLVPISHRIPAVSARLYTRGTDRVAAHRLFLRFSPSRVPPSIHSCSVGEPCLPLISLSLSLFLSVNVRGLTLHVRVPNSLHRDARSWYRVASCVRKIPALILPASQRVRNWNDLAAVTHELPCRECVSARWLLAWPSVPPGEERFRRV